MVINALSELFCGVNVYCATKMGAGKNEEANRSFTIMVISAVVTGLFITAVLKLGENYFIRALGATDLLFPYIKKFLSVAGWYLPLIIVEGLFSRFYVTAGNFYRCKVTAIIERPVPYTFYTIGYCNLCQPVTAKESILFYCLQPLRNGY